LIIIGLIIFFSGSLMAQDVEGSQDHPLISRLPETRIVFYEQVFYNEYTIALGDWDRDAEKFEDSLTLGGAGTRIVYFVPETYAPKGMYLEYKTALEEAGFEIFFSADDLSNQFGRGITATASFIGGLSSTRRGDLVHHINGTSEPHYIAAKKDIDGQEVYVGVLIGGGSIHRATPVIVLNVVEVEDIRGDLIEINMEWERELPERLEIAREDPEGSRDHPLISRFPGAKISFFTELEFDEYVLGLGYWDHGEEEFEESKFLEGRVTRILYEIPTDRTALEIFRNYQAALERGEFEILFSGAGTDELGRYGEAMYKQRYFASGVAAGHRRGDIGLHLGGATDQHYLAAKTSLRGQDVYVSVFVGGGSIHTPNPIALVNVVEVEALTLDLVSAGDLMEQIQMTGKALVYGIYFDTASYEIKDESGPMLEEIAVLLEENPEMHLYVVGHTDDQGSFDYNMTLSRNRARSVVNWLVDNHGIDEGRLQAVGVGPAAPEATNETSQGRANNRRVELVKKLMD